ncbi:MAG: NUDIX pyrophosphatase [Candidatus Zixiibacteriota bacterium]
MSRAPFQVLVFPYRLLPNGEIYYALFRREESTGGYWQGIAGGGESGESHLQAAMREAKEEAGIDPENEFVKLESRAMIPAKDICGLIWGDNVTEIPEFCFGLGIDKEKLVLSDEHSEYCWVDYTQGMRLLHWESNKKALEELYNILRTTL